MNENEAKTLIERFAEKQQGGHFACPRCGKMAMDAESVTRNALSRRATVHICSACKEEAVYDCNDKFVLSNYCPHCGARMEGSNEHETD